MPEDKRYSCKKPCAECPFSKAIPPGRTGGSHPAVYVGQGQGPFMLPCHMAEDYHKNKASIELPQCAGAAMYRANIGVADQMPSFIHKLPASPLAFESPAELLAHHLQISIERAAMMLLLVTPQDLLQREMSKITPEKLHLVPR